MGLPDKKRVHTLALEALQRDVDAAVAKAEDARRDATHAEAKQENDKDTRAIEQGYLARGIAARAEELLEQLTKLRFVDLRDQRERAIGPGALILLVDDSDTERVVFLVPAAGGLKVDVDGTQVALLTPASPVGRALAGKEEGDEIEVRIGRETRVYEIAEVS